MAQESKRENLLKHDKSLEELLECDDKGLLQWNNKILPYKYQTTEKNQQELFDEYHKEHPIENSDNKPLKERDIDIKKKSTANNDFQNNLQYIQRRSCRLLNQQFVTIQKLTAENEKLKAEKEQYEKLYNEQKNNKWSQQVFGLRQDLEAQTRKCHEMSLKYNILRNKMNMLTRKIKNKQQQNQKQRYQSVLPIIQEEPNIQNIKVDVLDLIKKGYIRGDKQMLNQMCGGRLLKDRYQKMQEHKIICKHHPVITLPTLYTGYGRTNIYK